MRFLTRTSVIVFSLCLLIAGAGTLYSQNFTNPVTLLFLSSSTGNPIGVSPQDPLPVDCVTGCSGGGGGGAITIASGAVASGAYSSGSIASGAIAAGAQVDLLTMRGTKNAGTAAANSILFGGVYNSTPLTLTNTQQASSQLDANGYLKVNIAAGSGGAVTIADGADVALGAVADAAWVSGNGTAISLLKNIATGVGSAIPAGSALIGKIDPGTIATWGLAPVAAGTAPTNMMVNGLIYNSTEISPTTGQSFALQGDSKGRVRGVIMDAAGNSRGANVSSSNRLSVETSIGASGVVSGAFASGALASGSIAAGAQVDLLTMRGTKAAGTAAANSALTGCVYNSTDVVLTDGQQAATQCGLGAIVITQPYAKSANLVSGVTSAMTGTTSTSLIAAPSGSLHNYVTQLICTNSHATVGTFVNVQDGSGGTTIYAAYAAAVGGGFTLTFPAPLRQPTAATALYVADVTTGANVICAASGFKAL